MYILIFFYQFSWLSKYFLFWIQYSLFPKRKLQNVGKKIATSKQKMFMLAAPICILYVTKNNFFLFFRHDWNASWYDVWPSYVSSGSCTDATSFQMISDLPLVSSASLKKFLKNIPSLINY